MREDESLTRCGCIIPHPSQASIFVRKVGDGHEIPSALLPWLRFKFFPDHIPQAVRNLMAALDSRQGLSA